MVERDEFWEKCKNSGMETTRCKGCGMPWLTRENPPHDECPGCDPEHFELVGNKPLVVEVK